MFTFGFDKKAAEPTAEAAAAAPAAPAEEIALSQGASKFASESVFINENLSVMRVGVSSEEAAKVLADGQLKGSDLISGRYEGGFKLWEGAVDLSRFMLQEWGEGGVASVPLAGKRVIELGCGQGIPGVVAMLAGAEVHFQDYNTEVVVEATVPTVRANWAAARLRGAQGEACPARFFAGGWTEVEALLGKDGLLGTYDLVLTSETIYNLDSLSSLVSCIKSCLKPSGKALVAAKTYYFGVGGGTQAFKAAVQTGGLAVSRDLLIDDPKSVQREIIELTRT